MTTFKVIRQQWHNCSKISNFPFKKKRKFKKEMKDRKANSNKQSSNIPCVGEVVIREAIFQITKMMPWNTKTNLICKENCTLHMCLQNIISNWYNKNKYI